LSGEVRIGELIGGRFEAHSGPHAYRSKGGCENPRCTRNMRVPDRCFGWHCCHCDEPSSYQGHVCTGRYINGEFRRFKDGQIGLSCQPGFDEIEVES
jgi:hypothetical protein